VSIRLADFTIEGARFVYAQLFKPRLPLVMSVMVAFFVLRLMQDETDEYSEYTGILWS
jgi:hypothetical protein